MSQTEIEECFKTYGVKELRAMLAEAGLPQQRTALAMCKTLDAAGKLPQRAALSQREIESKITARIYDIKKQTIADKRERTFRVCRFNNRTRITDISIGDEYSVTRPISCEPGEIPILSFHTHTGLLQDIFSVVDLYNLIFFHPLGSQQCIVPIDGGPVRCAKLKTPIAHNIASEFEDAQKKNPSCYPEVPKALEELLLWNTLKNTPLDCTQLSRHFDFIEYASQ